MEDEKYDATIHVTAKELRNNGVQIPSEIPDHAFVPKSAVKYDVFGAKTTFDAEKGVIHSDTPVHVNADWKWAVLDG